LLCDDKKNVKFLQQKSCLRNFLFLIFVSAYFLFPKKVRRKLKNLPNVFKYENKSALQEGEKKLNELFKRVSYGGNGLIPYRVRKRNYIKLN